MCEECRDEPRTFTDDERAQVARGVAWLDVQAPGWRTYVRNFNVSNPYNCVLAQVAKTEGWNQEYGSPYTAGLQHAVPMVNDDWGPAADWSHTHGFAGGNQGLWEEEINKSTVS